MFGALGSTRNTMHSVLVTLVPVMILATRGFPTTFEENSQGHLSARSLNGADFTEHTEFTNNTENINPTDNAEEHHYSKEGLEEKFNIAIETTGVIVLVLIILTIAFEKIRDAIEESATRSFKPIIKSLFGEVTVLGFLSLFTFLLTRFGVFEALSMIVFGEDEEEEIEAEEELKELFESVHYNLFFVMVLFVLQVLHILKESMKTEAEWLQLDYASRDEEYIEHVTSVAKDGEKRPSLSASASLHDSIIAISPSLRSRTNETIFDALRFHAFRHEFILDRSLEEPFEPAPKDSRVPDDFHLGRYLSMRLGQTVAHSVHLGLISWSLIAVFDIMFCFFIIVIEDDMTTVSWLWTLAGFLFLCCNIAVDRRLVEIEKNLASYQYSDKEKDRETQPLLNVANVDNLPLWCKIDLEKYKANRSFFHKMLDKTSNINRQDTLYPLGRQGPKALRFFFQFNLLFTSIYIGILSFNFAPYMYRHSTVITFVMYLILSIVPISVLLMQRRHLIAEMVMVTSVGIHRKPQSVQAVNIQAKTIKVIRGFVMVNQLLEKTNNGFFERPIEFNDDLVDSLSPVQRIEIENIFDGFDESGNGIISANELSLVFKHVGAPLSDEIVKKIVGAIDSDDSGDISKKEFVRFYVCHIMPKTMDMSVDERSRSLFAMFDTSHDGEITIGEMKSALEALNFGFTVDEVGSLIHEVDENGDGTVGLHDFRRMLDSYKNQIGIVKREKFIY